MHVYEVFGFKKNIHSRASDNLLLKELKPVYTWTPLVY